MNTTTQKQNVLAIVASIAILVSLNQVSIAAAHTPNTMPYGQVGQEDEDYFWHDGVLYINAVPTPGNGLFIAESDIDADYSIDQAIDRFGIDEDIKAFIVQPSQFSNVVIMYELDDNLQFQITHIYEDNESGLNQEVLQ